MVICLWTAVAGALARLRDDLIHRGVELVCHACQVASEVAKRSLSARTRASSSSVVSTLEVGRDGAGCAAVAMDRVKDKLHHPSP